MISVVFYFFSWSLLVQLYFYRCEISSFFMQSHSREWPVRVPVRVTRQHETAVQTASGFQTAFKMAAMAASMRYKYNYKCIVAILSVFCSVILSFYDRSLPSKYIWCEFLVFSLSLYQFLELQCNLVFVFEEMFACWKVIHIQIVSF